jgi:2-aminoadipate transaminase
MDLSEIKFTRGVPDPVIFPKKHLAECACAVLEQHGDFVLQYGPVGGFPPLRDWIAGQYKVENERILIAQGSLQIVDTISRIFIKPGDIVYIEEPSYDRSITVFKRAGARLVGIPLENDGLDVDALSERLRMGEKPVLFYIIPDFQNPSGKVLSLEKRKRVIALAKEYDFWVIEDSPYRKLRYKGEELPSLFELGHDSVMHISSFSKLIAPGLRTGYVIAPLDVARRLLKFSEDTYINPSYLNQGIVHEFIQRGLLETNLIELKKVYAPRLLTMLDALDEHMSNLADWTRPDGGFFIGILLRQNSKADILWDRARKVNLHLSDGRGFFTNGYGEQFVRLPFCALTEKEIVEGVERLAQLIRAI